MAPGGDPLCTLTFIGNATVLLQLGPFTILTDPNFLRAGQRAYLGYGLWSKRLKDPARTLDELPHLDAVVLSHLHGDHWDRVAQRGLDKAVPILTTEQAARTLGRRGFTAESVPCWRSVTWSGTGARLTLTALPGRHGQGVLDHFLPDVMGSLIELEVDGSRRLRLYLSGDTLYDDQLGEIARRFPDIDVAVVHLGGTKLLGLVTVTMDGVQGTKLAQLLRPSRVVPVHYDDYTVFTSPLSAFEEEMDRAGLAPRITVVDRGETVDLPLGPAAQVLPSSD